MIKKFSVCPHGQLYKDCVLCMDNAEDTRITKILRLYGPNHNEP